MSVQRPGVIWISGFSASGKTTVGRKVDAALKAKGIQSVFLDGDDLRAIFAARWGYEREDRIELARVYFRLCSHLAAQGCTVVIAAVAMYAEVRAWVRANVPGALEVFLAVPDEERRARDGRTKRIYSQVGDLGRLYDPPDDLVLSLDNSGTASAAKVAGEIVRRFLAREPGRTDFGRGAHWRAFYEAGTVPASPSAFAADVARRLRSASRILEVGCGNGRDAAFFAAQGHRVTAVDASPEAIGACRAAQGPSGIDFRAGTLPALAGDLPAGFDAVYARFVLHAMPLQEEEELLAAARGLLAPGGLFFIECRSIEDALARKGEVISPTERIFGHYRRFIVRDELRARLARHGFAVVEEMEGAGLAVQGEDDPVVIRMTVRKDG